MISIHVRHLGKWHGAIFYSLTIDTIISDRQVFLISYAIMSSAVYTRIGFVCYCCSDMVWSTSSWCSIASSLSSLTFSRCLFTGCYICSKAVVFVLHVSYIFSYCCKCSVIFHIGIVFVVASSVSSPSNIATIEKLCHSVAGGLIWHLSDGEQSWVQIDIQSATFWSWSASFAKTQRHGLRFIHQCTGGRLCGCYKMYSSWFA